MRDRAREIRLVTLGLSPRDTHARCVDLARELDDAVRDVTARIDARGAGGERAGRIGDVAGEFGELERVFVV